LNEIKSEVFHMHYEVAYLSNSGNTAALAERIPDLLPGETVHVTDLSQREARANADVYLVGFGVNRGTIPVKIMDALELAEGKTVLLFVTGGVEPTQEYQAAVERKILPFLPDDCDYRGLFLCAGQFPDAVVQNLQEVLRRQPDHAQARSLLEHHQKTLGHPNDSDVEHFRVFLETQLQDE
jgi:flavodoxin